MAAAGITSRANIKVDAASLVTPAGGRGDLNGDGFDDLVFRSATEPDRLRVVFGSANLAGDARDRTHIDPLRPAGTSRMSSSPRNCSIGTAIARPTFWCAVSDRAYVIAGKDIVIDGELAGHISNVATITRAGTTAFAADPVVVGDVNGDGLDDAMFVDALTAATQKAYLFVGRRTSGGAATLTLDAADATFDIGSFLVPESGRSVRPIAG